MMVLVPPFPPGLGWRPATVEGPMPPSGHVRDVRGPKNERRSPMRYLSRVGTRPIPQSAPLPGKGQVRNSAGGYVWDVDDWKRLDRFLILGSEGGTYYIAERALTEENANAVRRCIESDGLRAVN